MTDESPPTNARVDTNNPSSPHNHSDWYVHDLALAAELGKTLLDRNRVLEQALEYARAEGQQKDIELQLLHKQLSELRALSQKRGALVDEADGYNQELDRLNRQLIKELTADRQKIERLKAHVACLEQEVSHLSEQLDHCTCDHTYPLRPRSVTNTTDRCALRSGSHSPACYTPPPNHSTHSVTTRRHTVTTKGMFIDDEFQDQPQLSTCELHSNSVIQADSSHHIPGVRWPLGQVCSSPSFCPAAHLIRSSSWPALYVPDSPVDDIQPALRKPSHPMPRIQNASDLQAPTSGDKFSTSKHRGINSFFDDDGLRPPPRFGSGSSTHSTQPNERSSCTADDLKALKDVLDDATFIRHLEAIYCIKLRCQVSNDYQPRYKQLFQEAFQMLRTVKTSHANS
ncbi:hypothetical protein CRM22_008511 [Opisthorchis felineus]|nr:hypothetical protein CRM22_008511 [Opisthorchis felineus]